MTRKQIEALALARGVKLDGISDNVMAARLVLAKVPGTNANGSITYVTTAIETLAKERRDEAEPKVVRLDGEPSAAAARAAMVLDAENAWRSPLAAHIDDGDARDEIPHIDSKAASIEDLRAATARAQRRAREDSETAWTRPLRSDCAIVDGS